MPYGIDPALWRRLPPEDQVAIAAEVTGTSAAIGGYAPAPASTATPVHPATPASSAPPPNLSSGTTSRTDATGSYPAAQTVTVPTKPPVTPPSPGTGWTLASREAQVGRVADATDNEDDVLVLPGTRTPGSRGVTLVTAPTAWPTVGPPVPIPALPSPGHSGTSAAGKGKSVGIPSHPADSRPSGGPSQPADSRSPGGPLRRLAGDPQPGHLPDEEPSRAGVYDAIDQLKQAVETIHLRGASSAVDKQWQNWVRTHWAGAPFTTTQLQAALSLVKTETAYPFGKPAYENFKKTNPPGTPSVFDPVKSISRESLPDLVRRAWAIQSALANVRQGTRVAQQERVTQLQGAISAVGLVVAIVDRSVLSDLPSAGSYVGLGNPADAINEGFNVPVRSNVPLLPGGDAP